MSEILYKDAQVTVYKEMIYINRYYFPLATSKTIMFSDLQTVELITDENVVHRWGITRKYLNCWFNYDDIRKVRGKFIEFKLKGRRIRPAITCNDADKVAEIIWANFTPEGREHTEKMSEQAGQETEMAQHEMMEREKEEKGEKEQGQKHEVSEQVLNPTNKMEEQIEV